MTDLANIFYRAILSKAAIEQTGVKSFLVDLYYCGPKGGGLTMKKYEKSTKRVAMQPIHGTWQVGLAVLPPTPASAKQHCIKCTNQIQQWRMRAPRSH
jgi:hypothetical protein